MAELGSTNVNGDLRTTGDHVVGENNLVEGDSVTKGDSETNGNITEGGKRVFSPNNRNVSDSVTSASSSVYASSKAAKTAYYKVSPS